MRFGDAALQLGLLDEDDIQQVLSRQYDYTYLMPDDDSISKEVVAAFKPFSPVVEQLRVLRSQLLLRWFDVDAGGRALAVLSPDTGEGRSFVAANLAVVFSQLGQRTLLVDADLRRPCQHRLFRISDKLGLSSILAGRAETAECISRIPHLKDLSLLPSKAHTRICTVPGCVSATVTVIEVGLLTNGAAAIHDQVAPPSVDRCARFAAVKAVPVRAIVWELVP